MTSEYRLAFLSTEEAGVHWEHIAPLLHRACLESDGDITLENVVAGIIHGRYHVAVMLKGSAIVLAVVVEVITYPAQSVLNFTLMGGRDAKIFFDRFLQHFIDYAREVGCTQIQAGCGKAQTRLFNKLAGSRTVYSVIRLNI